jgi:hypothetical protein
MGLINADKLLEHLYNKQTEQCDVALEIAEFPTVDAVEVVRQNAVDAGYLEDWYIHSVANDEPVWTEAHLDELFNDFYLVPKDDGERRKSDA